MIFFENLLFKRRVALREGGNPGIQGHSEVSYAVLRPGRFGLSRTVFSCYSKTASECINSFRPWPEADDR